MSAEEQALVTEEELFELFERRRPERAAFRAGIEKRIAGHKGLEEEEAPEEPEQKAAGFWRRAAGLLPIDPLSLAAVTATGKAAGTKFLPAALALPVLLLSSAVAGFFGSVVALRRPSRTEEGGPEKALAWRAYGMSSAQGFLQAVFILVFLVTTLIGKRWMVDVITFFLILSMFALIHVVRAYGSVGLLTRYSVTKAATGLLIAVYAGFFVWSGSFHGHDGASDLGNGFPAAIVLLGIVACFLAGGQPRRGLVAAALVAVIFPFQNPAGLTQTSRSALLSQLGGFELQTDDLSQWEAAAAIHRALSAVGGEPPRREDLREIIATAARSQQDVHPTVWTSAMHMGLIEDSDWEHIAVREHEAYRLKNFLHPRATPFPRYYEHSLTLLLETHELSPEDHEIVMRKVIGAWPPMGRHGALGDAGVCLRMLDTLGRQDLIESLREKANELLTAYWIGSDDAGHFKRSGGFTPNPEKFRSSFDGDTLDAVEIIARYGAPAGVDLRQLHGLLRHESRAGSMFGDHIPYLNAHWRAALHRLREQITLPPRSFWRVLLGERLLLTCSLLVALCLIAVRMAPKTLEQENPGAQP